jgi:catechol 2,3-dioxygenase-like lactoylglutathione lyase family enzyme
VNAVPQVSAFDHIVLGVADVAATCAWYSRVLGMEPREERPGKWSLHFGKNKVSLQDCAALPRIARNTLSGTSNFCLLSETAIADWRVHLAEQGVTILDSGERVGAMGAIDSLYFNDPDGNLVEVSNQL